MGALESRIERKIEKELRACRTQDISDCGITANTINKLESNPAGTNKNDVKNPGYQGKIDFKLGNVEINLRYVLTGNIKRAEVVTKNIANIFGKGGIKVNFQQDHNDFDLRIHGATLSELAEGLKLCDCESALKIGGWGPSYKHLKWGKALLVNPYSPRGTWKMSDAHEFGHKLGLKHRINQGIMDYPPKRGFDQRKLNESDKQRIIYLYK